MTKNLDLFIRYCQDGKTANLATLIDVIGSDNFINIAENGFYTACMMGHLSTAKLIYEIYTISIHISNNSLICACFNGHAGIIELLLAMFPNIDGKTIRMSFKYACYGGNLAIASKLLHQFPDIIIQDSDNLLLPCVNGKLDIIIWLLDTFPTMDVHYNNDICIRWAIRKGHHDIVFWLLTNYDTYRDVGIFRCQYDEGRDIKKEYLQLYTNIIANNIQIFHDFVDRVSYIAADSEMRANIIMYFSV